MYCRTFGSIPGVYLVDASNTPPPVAIIKNVTKHCQTLPRGKLFPDWEPVSKIKQKTACPRSGSQ